MPAEHDADEFRVFARDFSDLQAEIEARPQPGEIAEFAAKDLLRQL